MTNLEPGPIREVAIRDDSIRLGQLLKLANIAPQGSDARLILAGKDVLVNGEVEVRRGRTLHLGDLVEYDGTAYRVVQQ